MKADGVKWYGRQQSWKRYGKAERTPPGSESGACAYGGSSGTWENPLSPGERIPEEKGYRLTKRPGAGRRLLPAGKPLWEATEQESYDEVSGSELSAKRPEMG